MLIGVDDTTKNVTTLGTFFFNFCLQSHSSPPRDDWWKSDSLVSVLTSELDCRLIMIC